MIYIDIENDKYYDDALVLVRSFYPRAEVARAETARAEATGADAARADAARADAARTGTASAENTSAELTGATDDAAVGAESHVIVAPDIDDEGLSKSEAHNTFKRVFYEQLRKATGKELPWGYLTGVRPSKIAYAMLEKGTTDGEIIDEFVERHYVSEEKARLALDVARNEMELLDGVDYNTGYSLYIGIPFCPTTCLYCSFASNPIASFKNAVDEYLDRLIDEIKAVCGRLYESYERVDTVYIGGGTPTTLEPEQLDRLLFTVKEALGKDYYSLKEFTVEAGRPDSITREKLQVIKKYGVGRISVNPQTMNDETLALIGRRHSVAQVVEAYELARDVGFDNINMDIIVGLPGEGLDEVTKTLQRIEELRPDSLTVHSLAIKRAAALNIWRDKYRNMELVNSDEIMKRTRECSERLGMKPYYMYRQKNMAGNFENVGYARPGCECLYNILIMEEKQTIAACGAGASTKVIMPMADGSVRIERAENVKDVRIYCGEHDAMLVRKNEFFDRYVAARTK